MKKLQVSVLLFLGLVGVLYYVGSRYQSNEEVVGSANVPDRCEVFTQRASRSIKANVKASAGSLYSYKVQNQGAAVRYFQLHDASTTPTGSTTIDYSVQVPGTTSSTSPGLVEEKFPTAFKFDNGIGFSISPNFGTFSSTGVNRDLFMVTLCYN